MSKASFRSDDFLPRVAPRLALPQTQAEAAGDRILLTLLSLGLMLLAFFVVLTALGSFDTRRMRGVVESVQDAFEKSNAQNADVVDARLRGESDRAAVDALRASVADIFAHVIAGDTGLMATADANHTRVEIDVPMALFFTGADELAALPLLDKIVAVVSSPPAGYRTELAARAKIAPADAPQAQTRVAVIANALVARGAAPTSLLVGTLRDAPADATPMLRFSFLLLRGEDDVAAARLVTAP